MRVPRQAQSRRMQAVQAPVIPVVAELIAENPGTISLGQGVVNYGPPSAAMMMLEQFASDPANHKYQHVQGIPRLLEALRVKLETENGVGGAGRELIVTAGSNMGFLNAILAIADPGDEVILLRPFYFNQEMALSITGCRAVVVDTDAHYQPVVAAIEAAITSCTRAVVTISPNNPSGAVYAASTLRDINELCRARGIYHISDEAYEYFTFDEAVHFSPASLPGSEAYTIALYSFSKAYGFASWRIGYMVVPEELLAPIKKIQDTNLICPPVISQYAALGALEAGAAYCRERVAGLVPVRDLVLRKLASLGNRVMVPRADGAFYFLLKLASARPAMEVVENLVREHKVAVIPGSTFGLDSPCSLRVAYGALAPETVEEGTERLVAGLDALLG